MARYPHQECTSPALLKEAGAALRRRGKNVSPKLAASMAGSLVTQAANRKKCGTPKVSLFKIGNDWFTVVVYKHGRKKPR